jgi:hypothetical protein
MEDCAGLLRKTMNSALYWLSHLIDMLLAFVFSITSLISSLAVVNVVAVDVFVNVSTATTGNEKDQPSSIIMGPRDPHFTLGKCSFNILSIAPKKGKKRITWWCFSLSFLDCSDGSHHHHSRYEFRLSAV